jgi:hypothetical protein
MLLPSFNSSLPGVKPYLARMKIAGEAIEKERFLLFPERASGKL